MSKYKIESKMGGADTTYSNVNNINILMARLIGSLTNSIQFFFLLDYLAAGIV